MPLSVSVLIEIEKLRVGMYVQLKVGWLNHPFPKSSFLLTSREQITQLRQLGLRQVRVIPEKSTIEIAADAVQGQDAQEVPLAEDESSESDPSQTATAPTPLTPSARDRADRERALLNPREEWDAAFVACEEQYYRLADLYQGVCSTVMVAPAEARMQVQALVEDFVAELLGAQPFAIRLLPDVHGSRTAMHAVNVMVLSTMLANALGEAAQALRGVAAAALQHDLGKMLLPLHIAEPGTALAPADLRRYEEHVAFSVDLCARMGWDEEVLQAIAQHHEMADGSGFPRRLRDQDMRLWGKIVAVVNAYDRLCNPLHGRQSLTPHNALAQMYARERSRFDPWVLEVFIRMMGVYPPGSLVQLTDERYAQVVLVDARHPLRPSVLVFDPALGEDEARTQLLDLAQAQGLGIVRSLKPEQLPQHMLEFFAVRQYFCYFFENVRTDPPEEGKAP